MHEVEAMMYTGATPWHGLGKHVDKAPTGEDAIKMAGLDWKVETHPLQTNGEQLDVAHRATVRSTDRRVLGVVGPSYVPLQNAKAFEFFDPFLRAGEASLETAGSLREGSRIWILAKLNREPSVIVKQSDDVVNKYVLLANGHDGSLAVSVGFTPIRVVCANTLALAAGESERGNGAILKVSHQRHVEATLEKVREAMNLADARFEASAEQYRFLASRGITTDQLKRFVKLVFKPKVSSIDETLAELSGEAVASSNTKPGKVEDTVVRLFESGKGNTLPGVRGTFWAAYNAITEYVSYERGSNNDTRLNETWFGEGARINKRALAAGMQLAA